MWKMRYLSPLTGATSQVVEKQLDRVAGDEAPDSIDQSSSLHTQVTERVAGGEPHPVAASSCVQNGGRCLARSVALKFLASGEAAKARTKSDERT